MTFQEMIFRLTHYWADQGCLVAQGYDLEVGAGTFNPTTFLRCLGPEPYAAVYVEPSRRPQDGRYGKNPNRVQLFHQMQVILKPSPPDMQELYLNSLAAIGLDLSKHDIRFVHDDWENPTIGAWGLGWEVWIDGMEVTQYTYFQAVGGSPVSPVSGELTYGLERLAMYIQNVDSIFDLKWNDTLFYGDIYKRNELEWSHYNFEQADTTLWHRHFEDFEKEALRLTEQHYPIPAYDFVMKASHAFNMMDARGALSVTERARYIGRIRTLARGLADCYLKSREAQAFPLLKEKQEASPIAAPKVEVRVEPKKRADFLLEIGSEELPATFVPIGMQNLKEAIEKELKEFEHGEIHVYGTPRRLAVLVKDLAGGTEALQKERKGPSVKAAFDGEGNPTKAGQGFFQSIGLPPSLEQEHIEVRDGYIFAHLQSPGKSTTALLARALPKLILSLEFPKKMRWGDLSIEYARPLRWIVALYGKEVIPFALGNLLSGQDSFGHRQLAPTSFSISNPSDYLKLLREKGVIADPREREEIICKALPDEAIEVEKVLPHVIHLVEYPFPFIGTFDQTFLRAPKEVLISEMVEHQKYFPMMREGKLLPSFVVVSNNRESKLICHGHERALSPRLADGVFLYEEDLKTPLSHFNEKLKKMTYQAKLGSLWDKVQRLIAHGKLLHQHLPLAPLEEVVQATTLCKADLATTLVGEFPELQGLIGKLYAEKSGEKEEIATAIDEHWMPRREKAPLPKSGAGILLALADKIDNLLSCFILNQKPTSSSDPFALRRQALGIMKILIENQLHLPLETIFEQAFDLFPKLDVDKEAVLTDLKAFLINRLRTVLLDYGFGKDEIEAVLVFDLQSVYDLYLRLEALHAFRKKSGFEALIEVEVRTKKILLSQNKRLVPSWKLKEALHTKRFPPVEEKLLHQACEKELFLCTQQLKNRFQKILIDRRDFSNRNYPEAFTQLTLLQKPVAKLFDEVKVIDDDEAIRTNRLALLQEVYDLCEELADFSKLS
ncbi:MAG: hypothetical protein S4CHLAM45_05480 [Chlamydiales bacterium]|nr:hypothetical protein [Chlamydiales bacterium]MCH9619911.1 hypothetical protein [Chlamydiales bacterium]MCH9622662.1 hypothetical protein [Chlamydiales bacterium]